MAEQQSLFTLGISKNEILPNKGHFSLPKFNLWKYIKKGVKTALFMEALRNLNWSRSYLWYVELDSVPNPFHRGGVLGLPCESITYTITDGTSYDWNAGIASLSAPQTAGGVKQMNLTVLDDEQGTLRQFFERWYNEIYNPYNGVLPLTEACKQISIYFQKSTRRNVQRIYYDIDKNVSYVRAALNKWFNGTSTETTKKQTSESMDFLVYPSGPVQLTLDSNSSSLIKFTVSLQVAHIINPDFGDPTKHPGVQSIGDQILGKTSTGDSWLDKIADYI